MAKKWKPKKPPINLDTILFSDIFVLKEAGPIWHLASLEYLFVNSRLVYVGTAKELEDNPTLSRNICQDGETIESLFLEIGIESDFSRFHVYRYTIQG